MSARAGILSTLLTGASHLIAPRVCGACRRTLTVGEDLLCLGCLLELPRTYQHRDDFNEIHRRLGHRYKVDRAAGWFYYKKGTPYADLLVDAKYNGRPSIARKMGRMCATELAADGFYAGIDALVPMPMYWTKRLRRGYNQAEEICRGISEVTGIPVVAALKCEKPHGVQARHSKSQRFSSIDGTIAVRDAAAICGRHVLLVDDIITTGASCIEALRALSTGQPGACSVLSLGLTSLL